MESIVLDGSAGGGQMLRTALGLSAALRMPFRMENIRYKRERPGLMAQHMSCVEVMAKLCNANVEGNHLYSMDISFFPQELNAQQFGYDIGTAGSTVLMFQSILLPAMFLKSPLKVSLGGGTDVPFAMPVEYLRHVLLPALAPYVDVRLSVQRRGYYPIGDGLLEATIIPLNGRKEISLVDQYPLIQVKGICHASKDLMPARVAENCARMIELKLSKIGVPLEIKKEYAETESTGCGIELFAFYGPHDAELRHQVVKGVSTLGERGKRAEVVGEEVAERLKTLLAEPGVIDEHLADNLIPYLVLFGGKIKTTRITDHIRTNIYVCEQFVGKRFTVDESTNTISVEMGYVL